MQHSIRSRGHPFGSQLSSGWTEEGEQFGGATSLILMGVRSWMALRLPASPRLGDGLVRPGFIFIELYDPCGLCLFIRQLD